MSRVPRAQEHLKTGFAAEAAAAARYRAYAARASEEGLAALAEQWSELAQEKDRVAIRQLEASGQVRGEAASVADALAEERFGTDVLYPKMIADVDEATAEVFREVVDSRKQHVSRLRELRSSIQAGEDL